MIQSAVRGHMGRKDQMRRQSRDSRRSSRRSVYSDEEDSEMDDAALTIQSAVRGRMSRKDYMKKSYVQCCGMSYINTSVCLILFSTSHVCILNMVYAVLFESGIKQ